MFFHFWTYQLYVPFFQFCKFRLIVWWLTWQLTEHKYNIDLAKHKSEAPGPFCPKPDQASLDRREFWVFSFITLWWGFWLYFWPWIISIWTRSPDSRAVKHICIEDKFILRLTVNPRIALTQFQNNTALIRTPDLSSMSPRSHRKQVLGQHATLKIIWPQWAINLSPRNGHVLLVCEYLWQVSTHHGCQ